MKKTIQLTAIENLISTYYITPYFNTLLNIPLSFKKKKFKMPSNIFQIFQKKKMNSKMLFGITTKICLNIST